MSSYNTPGVYIEEISTLPASIVPVATAIPAFVGVTEKYDLNPNDNALQLTPTRITSMVEYEKHFGGPVVALSVDASYTVTAVSGAENNKLYYAVRAYFANGGGPCWIVATAKYNTTTAGANVAYSSASSPFGLKQGLDKLEEEDEPTLVVIPDAVSLAQNDFNSLTQDMLAHCAKLQDRFAILDSKVNAIGSSDLTTIRGGVGTQNLKYGAMYMPYLVDAQGYPDTAVNLSAVSGANLSASLATAETDGGVAAALLPNLKNYRDAIATQSLVIPPSGAIAGIYATVDRNRGVWKAPANISLNGVSKPSFTITAADQELLNVDAGTGKSINAIRPFSGKGILVWGARTLDGNSNEWRYVPVRRLYIFVEESIKKATEFVVFEPNDANTWTKVRTMIENFLTGIWRDGALAGAKPDDAFFVNVGLGETMTAQDILEGRLIIEIGLAAVRPAEFIILKFSHKLQES
ncbi:MAG: phage tail sheath C-terminal domain-containing protein [Bacteroidota bacterium]